MKQHLINTKSTQNLYNITDTTLLRCINISKKNQRFEFFLLQKIVHIGFKIQISNFIISDKGFFFQNKKSLFRQLMRKTIIIQTSHGQNGRRTTIKLHR